MENGFMNALMSRKQNMKEVVEKPKEEIKETKKDSIIESIESKDRKVQVVAKKEAKLDKNVQRELKASKISKTIATYVSDEVYKEVVELSQYFGKSRSELIQLCEIEYFNSLDGKPLEVKESLFNDLKPVKNSLVSKNVLQLVTNDNGKEINSNAGKCGYTKLSDYLRDSIEFLLPKLREKAN